MHSLEASCKLAIVVLGVLALQRMDAEKRQKKKKRRIWTKAWLRKRDLVPPAASIRDLPEKSPDDFRNYLRMADESYQQLLRLVSPRIQKKDTHMRSAIPAELRLRATLQYLATGRSFEDLKFMLNIAAPTLGKIIPETCQAIIEALSPEYLKFPQTAVEWKVVGQQFEEAWQFPNCGGAIVGKHVRIHPPAHSGSYFYNHKGYFSIVLLAIVNANCEFVYVDVGKNGRTCAGGVLDQTEFSNRLKNGQLNLPSRAETKDGLNFVFVADKAFALGEHLLKPFPVKLLSNEKRIFNSRLSRARSVAENAFDALANRFRIFQTTINLSVHKIDLVVHACCVLHNFLHRSNPEYLPPATTECPDGVVGEEQGLASLMPTMSRKATGPARENRNKYMKYFMGDGAVDWQNDCLTT